MNKVFVNLGCGGVRPDSWQNYDSSLNSFVQSVPIIKHIARFFKRSVQYGVPARYLDLRSKWPFKDQSVSILYASHLLEHLSQRQASHFMQEANRVLEKKGVIRIVVPDLKVLSENYLSSLDSTDHKASQEFLYAMNLHKENAYAQDLNIFSKLINLMQGYPHQHKYMYEEYSLKHLLHNSSFENIDVASYGESRYVHNISDVECTAEGIPSIYLEALNHE